MDEPRSRFDAAVLDRLTTALTEHLGPGACVVVAKAADRSLDVYELCMSLATHVPTTAHAQFLASIDDVLRAGSAGTLTPAALAQAARPAARQAFVAAAPR